MSVFIFATLDTKGPETDYLRKKLIELGVEVKLVDTGSLGPPTTPSDIPRETLFAAAGTSLAQVTSAGDRGEAVTAAARGAAHLARRHLASGELEGVLAIGGSAGATIGSAAMRAMPLGVPKLLVSTLVSGQTRHYVGDKDIMLLNAVVDFAGLNRVSRSVLATAASAMAGMVKQARSAPNPLARSEGKPLVAATMFGVTTPCVEVARAALERAGCEVLVFHATGAGGQAMESLIAEGVVDGVLDITTTELADELVGGVLSAGPTRLTAAGAKGIPQVVSVGALDMVNFHGPESTPAAFRDRKFHRHNAHVTLMRTTPEENAKLGAEIGAKLSAAAGPARVFLPRRGVSALDRAGAPFDDPVAREALFTALRAAAPGLEIVELDRHINDPEFALAAAERLLEFLLPTANAKKPGTLP